LGIENAQRNELHKAKNDNVSIALSITPNFWPIRIYVLSIIFIIEKVISHKHILITIYSPRALLFFLDRYYKITKSIVKLIILVTMKVIVIRLI